MIDGKYLAIIGIWIGVGIVGMAKYPKMDYVSFWAFCASWAIVAN